MFDVQASIVAAAHGGIGCDQKPIRCAWLIFNFGCWSLTCHNL